MSAKYLENISKMLRRWCWENVGKFFAKCCQNVRKSWQNIGKLLVKCWVTVTVRKKLAKYWRHHHISYMKKVFIVEPLSFMYPKISLISIHLNEVTFSDQTFISAFHSRDSTHDFNTQSGGALRLPFLDSERRSESIFGIESAPPLSSYIWCWKRAPPPAFNPYLALRAPPLSSYLWCWERGRLSTHI